MINRDRPLGIGIFDWLIDSGHIIPKMLASLMRANDLKLCTYDTTPYISRQELKLSYKKPKYLAHPALNATASRQDRGFLWNPRNSPLHGGGL